MKETAHILVKLRVPDLVTLTAKGVIIKNMKVSQLVDIQREDWWQIQISGEKEEMMKNRGNGEKGGMPGESNVTTDSSTSTTSTTEDTSI